MVWVDSRKGGSVDITFYGAAEEVTGSCYLIRNQGYHVLLECGLFQGMPKSEARNSDPLPFDPKSIDAVILSHAHIDHSGRLPLLVKAGYSGPIYTQEATRDLCNVMLADSAFLNEKEAEWANRKRERKGLPLTEPLYTMEDARHTITQFKTVYYHEEHEVVPGVKFILHDAGHILGASIVEIVLSEGGVERRVVFSGDLGQKGLPILRDPEMVSGADLVLMESTYGDRLHRSWKETLEEFRAILLTAKYGRGNILIPAFTVGRTQEILYLFSKYYHEWRLDRWQIFLDSPMAIDSTEIYSRYSELYDREAREVSSSKGDFFHLPNFHLSRTTEESMKLNQIRSGAIIIAGSGMCAGGRIKHHLKHNIWRKDTHLIISGFQARGTLGRLIVDGAAHIRLWGETIKVAATVHTIGGLSAHADQHGLLSWYQKMGSVPPVVLVHGEPSAQEVLKKLLQDQMGADVTIATPGMRLNLLSR